jgi:hypothetical protein
MATYILSTIAATPEHARECGTPLLERARVTTDGSARDALVEHIGDTTHAFIPYADYWDTAVAYETCDPDHPLIWVATRKAADPEGRTNL